MDAVGDEQAGKKKKRILKRIIRTRKPDGTYTSKEILITDPKEVGALLFINIFIPLIKLRPSMTRGGVCVRLFRVAIFSNKCLISYQGFYICSFTVCLRNYVFVHLFRLLSTLLSVTIGGTLPSQEERFKDNKSEGWG
jgi:hypothetical protein